MSPEIAALLARAGFASVEVGLQSTNPRALRAIRRHWNRDRFLRGADLLRRRNIEVRIGIIIGLPWDGLEELDGTLSFLLDQELTAAVEVYPLALLPGTELRDRAGDLGISYMALPPYWVTSTNSLSAEQLLQGVGLIEERLDAELFPPVLPRFRNPEGFTGYLDLRDPRKIDRSLAEPPRLATSVTVHVHGSQLRQPGELAGLERLADRLRSTHPFGLFQLVIEAEEVPQWQPARRLAEHFRSPGHFFERSRSLEQDLQGSFSARLFHLTASPEVARRYYEQPLPFELLLRCHPGLPASDPDLLEEHPLLLLEARLSPADRQTVASLYRGFERLLVEPGPPASG